MAKTEYIEWGEREGDRVFAYNQDEIRVGCLKLELWGRHMHWSWYQESWAAMSPGCVEEIRKKQKELFWDRKRRE
jgi:hypothetical protein